MKIASQFYNINTQIIFLSVIFPLSLMLSYKFKQNTISAVLMLMPVFLQAIYSIIFFCQGRVKSKLKKNFVIVLILFLSMAILNFLISESQPKTFVMMITFFSYIIYSYIQLNILSNKINTKTLSISINTSLAILLVLGYEYLVTITVVGQTVALYAGAGIIFGLYGHNDIRAKVLYSFLPIFMLFLSSSRGSFIIVCFLISISSLFMLKNKKFLIGLFVIFLISIFSRVDLLVENFLSMKTTAKYENNMDSVSNSVLQREVRILSGFKVFEENPLLGIGVGGDIESKMYKYIGIKHSPHNGYITTLIEGGIILGGGSIAFILFSVIKILNIKKDFISDNFTLLAIFIFYYLIRAMGENYLIFNFGNLVSILFLFYIFNSFFKKKVA